MVDKLGNWAVLSCALGLALACSGQTAHNSTSAATAGGAAASAGKTSASGDANAGGMGGLGGNTTGGVAMAGAPHGGFDAFVPEAGAAGEGTGGSIVQPDPNDILKVKPSPGCGKAATQAFGEFVKYTIQTSGTKDANCADKLGGVPKCGAWTVPRDYYVWLPPEYKSTQAYPLVIQAPGCGGIGTNVYSLSPTNTDLGVGANGTVIRVGLTPPPSSIGHGTNENQGCFDDKEGDDSVDFVFYENLIDKLKNELCYDENRVYANGNSSGAWLANELGCKYAGNTEGYAIRAVLVNTGGLPNQPQWSPTCTNKPMAGLWIWEIDDIGSASSGNKFAVARAMDVNGCTATSYDEAVQMGMTQNYAIGGGNLDSTCQRILGCDANYPLVACALPSVAHGSHEDIANPAFTSMFLTLAAH